LENNQPIGIMQGRLSNAPENSNLDWFPFEKWENEFQAASKIGYNYIELVLDKYSDARNPLLNANLLEKLHLVALQTKIKTTNCCVNSIITQSLQNNDEIRKIQKLLNISQYLGINKIILPLFDASKPTEENFSKLVRNIHEISNQAFDLGVAVLIESNMGRIEAERLFEYLKFRCNIGMVYDVGNMTHCGYDVVEDIHYFFDLIKLVHIKDKDKLGSNVRLGTGEVDFDSIIKCLKDKKYSDGYTLETARGAEALNEASINLSFIKKYFPIEV
jgi:sugar phosphate isomerase/epimerase